MLVPVSLFPGYLHMVGNTYIVGALIFTLGFLAYSIRFARVSAGGEAHVAMHHSCRPGPLCSHGRSI